VGTRQSILELCILRPASVRLTENFQSALILAVSSSIVRHGKVKATLGGKALDPFRGRANQLFTPALRLVNAAQIQDRAQQGRISYHTLLQQPFSRAKITALKSIARLAANVGLQAPC
jgi:hypothetical protein